jgi:hypothetical protein
MELQEFKIPEPCNTYLDWQHTSSLDMRIHQPGFLQLGFLQTNFLQAGFDRMNKIKLDDACFEILYIMSILSKFL